MAEQYNGWRNWDTWNAYQWITSFPATYRLAMKVASLDSSQALKGWFKLHFGPNKDNIDYNEVDWQELREVLKGD